MLSVLYRQTYFMGVLLVFIGILSVSDRYCIGIVSVEVFFRHFIGISVVCYRYSIGIVSVFYRYFIVICTILSVQVFDRYLIGIVSVCYRYYIDRRIVRGVLSVFYRYLIDIVSVLYRYRYFFGISSAFRWYVIGILSVF